MRVLHVGKYFPPCPGGIEYVLADLLRAQRRAGIESAAVVHHHERGQPTTQEGYHGSPIWRVRTFGTLVYAPIAPTFFSVLHRAVKDFRPDVLHLHMPNTSALLAPAGVPYVVHWHSDVVPSRLDRRLAWAYKLYRPLEKQLLKNARRIVATSQIYLDTSKTLVHFSEKCDVVPLGVDPARLPEPEEEARKWARRQWPEGKLRVLAIGRLTYYKGHEDLIQAMVDAPDLSLCLVGKGDLEEKLNLEVAVQKLTDRVKLIGYAEDVKVRALLAECDCLALPSVERTEAFGVVLLEAMRYGKPVVATTIPGSGVNFVVLDDYNGLMVPVGDPAALRAALLRLHHEPELRKRLGERGAQRFANEFHIDRMAAMLSDVYAWAVA